MAGMERFEFVVGVFQVAVGAEPFAAARNQR